MAITSKRIGLLPVLLAGIALWQWNARRCEREMHRNKLAAPRAAPEEVTTWEGEGGALHGTGAQLGPDPAGPAGGAR